MPFTYVVNVYSDMSLSKEHLGSRGSMGSEKNIHRKTYITNIIAEVALKGKKRNGIIRLY